MIFYKQNLKSHARHLRENQTDAEKFLWHHIRRKQLCNTQFYRQKPIGNYIVDFYAPTAKLIIELVGGQHFEEDHMMRDKEQDHYLAELNLKVIRFDNLQVLRHIKDVLEMIFYAISQSKLIKEEGYIQILPNPLRIPSF